MRTHVLAAVLSLAAISHAHAQEEASDENLRRAIVLFEESELLYNQGDLAQAVALLQRAYQLHPNATLLFNLGRAQEGLGQLDDAIASYERYLAEGEDIEDRGAIERRVQTLREQRERLQSNDEPPPDAVDASTDPAPPPEAPTSGPSVDPAPWIVAGAGVAILGAAVVLGVLSLTAGQEAAGASEQTEAVAFHSDAEAYAIAANVLFGVGGAAALAGAIWGIVSLTSGDDAAAEIALGPGHVEIRGRF